MRKQSDDESIARLIKKDSGTHCKLPIDECGNCKVYWRLARKILAALRRRGWREPVKKKGAKQMAITTGQMPAFPVNLPGWGDNGASGMTLRDYFAGQALIALFAASAHPEHIGISESYYKDTGIECYKIADALISAKESMP